jgi:hypothetical protein
MVEVAAVDIAEIVMLTGDLRRPGHQEWGWVKWEWTTFWE